MPCNRSDIAKRAGVSEAVVSYVLNNSNYVSAQKRQAVLEAVRELGYTPNPFARSMKTGKTYCFAIVADDIRHEMFAEMLYYMEHFSFDYGYSVMLCSARYDDGFINRLAARRFDGIFLTSNGFSSQQINRIAQEGASGVLFQSRTYAGLDQRVIVQNIDFRKAVLVAVERLLSLGHRRIGFIQPYLYNVGCSRENPLRAQSFVEAMAGRGEGCICSCVGSYSEISAWAVQKAREGVTAFIASNDTEAAHVLKGLQASGLTVPADVSIIGLDDTFASSITTPSITTVGFNKKEFVMTLIDNLIHAAKGRPVENRCFDVSLVERESLAPFRRQEA